MLWNFLFAMVTIAIMVDHGAAVYVRIKALNPPEDISGGKQQFFTSDNNDGVYLSDYCLENQNQIFKLYPEGGPCNPSCMFKYKLK